jgi:NAD(P)-dependent dehydrogenase (short-subunit alcohol dehydrogenase family)
MATNWDGSHMPSQAGKIALVTGGAQGIGYQCVRQLVAHGARVIIADYDVPKGRGAVLELRKYALTLDGTPDEIEFLRVDLGCMESVKSFAETLHSKVDRLDLLINNAGVGVPTERKCTDGYSIQFGINHLGHFYLTTLVLDLLRKSKAARVVNVTSLAHRQELSYLLRSPLEVDFDKIATGEGDSAWMAYEKSKLCNLLFTYELDRRLRAAGVTNVQSVVAHPGITNTNIWGPFWWMVSPFLQSSEMGALPVLYAATVKDVESGQFFGPNGWRAFKGYPTREESSPESRSLESARALWTLSEELTKTKFEIQ